MPLWDEQGNIAKMVRNDQRHRRSEAGGNCSRGRLLKRSRKQIWTSPPDGKIDYCNELWRSYMGLQLEEFSKLIGLQSILHPDVRGASDKEPGQEAVTNGDALRAGSTRAAEPTGKYRWFSSAGRAPCAMPSRRDRQMVRYEHRYRRSNGRRMRTGRSRNNTA